MNKNENKKIAVLFTTRFLERNGKLFDAESIVECNKSFESNETYCDFFLGEETRDELKEFVCDEYYKDSLCSFFNRNDLRDKNLDDIIKVLGETDSIYNDALNEIKKNRCKIILKDGKTQIKHIFPKRLVFKNNTISLLNESPKKNELVKYIKSCKIESLKKLRINIDCQEDYDDLLSFRFKLYKLNMANNIVAYAVWPLSRPCNNEEMQKKWYKALYTEIINDNLDEKGESEIEEVNLFLHDADIKPSTPFTVLKINAEYDFVKQGGVPLNIALFQHNDKIGGILKTVPDNDEEKKKLLESANNKIENVRKLSFLNELSDFVAYWHDGGMDSYKNKILEAEKIGINNLITEINENTKVADVLSRIKKEIDIIVTPHNEESSK